MKKWTMRLFVALVVGSLGLAACGDDDGTEVRDEDGGTESATGSASATASGSGSASASASAIGCEPVGDPSTADETIAVELNEWNVIPEVDSTSPGAINFATENTGAEPHELVVVRAESAEDLPTDENGAVVEGELPDDAFVGEIEEYPPGETCDGVFELDAGDYVLFCNIVEVEEDGTFESHFAEGMYTDFSVSG